MALVDTLRVAMLWQTFETQHQASAAPILLDLKRREQLLQKQSCIGAVVAEATATAVASVILAGTTTICCTATQQFAGIFPTSECGQTLRDTLPRIGAKMANL